jgi:hypothetical protein
MKGELLHFGTEGWVSKRETSCLLVMLVLFFAVNLATCSWFPESWCDEVMYSDPAIRYVLGKGFTSAAWPSQQSNEFWAGNCPLQQLLLIPWLWTFGVSMTSIRSFCYVAGTIGVAILWQSVRQAGWISTAVWRLMLVVLLLSAYGMTHMFRCGRPDSITMLIAAAVLWEISRGETMWRKWRLLILGAGLPWAGLQLLVFVMAVLLFCLLICRRQFWRIGIWLSCGAAMGLLLLLGMYWSQGVAVRFLENTVASGHTLSGELAQMAVHRDSKTATRAALRLNSYLHFYRVWLLDPSYPWVVASLVVSSLWACKARLFKICSPLGFGLVAGLGVPVLVLISGKYPIYYTWMGFLIVAPCTLAAISDYWSRWDSFLRCITLVPLMIACLVGLPKALWEAVCGARVYSDKIGQFVQQNVVNSDRVFVDGAVYYATIREASETYYVSYGGGRGLREIPMEERNRINVMIIDSSHFEDGVKKVGGKWIAGPSYTILANPFGTKSQLLVYRRIK